MLLYLFFVLFVFPVLLNHNAVIGFPAPNASSLASLPATPLLKTLLDVGLNEAIENTISTASTSPIFPPLLGVYGVFQEGDVLLANFTQFGDFGARLSRCDYCLNATQVDIYNRKLRKGMYTHDEPPFPRYSNLVTGSAGPVLEADKWRVHVLKAMNMTFLQECVNRLGSDYAHCIPSNTTMAAQVQLIADSGEYLSRTLRNIGKDGCTLVTVNSIASTPLTIWELVPVFQDTFSKSDSRHHDNFTYALKDPASNSTLVLQSTFGDDRFIVQPIGMTCNQEMDSGKLVKFTVDTIASYVWKTPFLPALNTRAPINNGSVVKLSSGQDNRVLRILPSSSSLSGAWVDNQQSLFGLSREWSAPTEMWKVKFMGDPADGTVQFHSLTNDSQVLSIDSRLGGTITLGLPHQKNSISQFTFTAINQETGVLSWRLLPNSTNQVFSLTVNASYAIQSCNEISCGNTGHAWLSFNSLRFHLVDDLLGIAAASLPPYLPVSTSANEEYGNANQQRQFLTDIGYQFWLYNSMTSTMLVNGHASDVANIDQTCSYSDSCSSVTYGSVHLPDIAYPVYAVKTECTQQFSPYQGQTMTCTGSFVGNQWRIQPTQYYSNGPNDVCLTSEFIVGFNELSFPLAYMNTSVTSSIVSSNSLRAVYPVSLASESTIGNQHWEIKVVSNPAFPVKNGLLEQTGTLGPIVVIRPAGLDGYFLGICTQCQWSYNMNNNATVVALLNTTQDDPLVQFTIVSAQN